MKTTIELPDETLRRAKIYAAENHTTLKNLFTQALENFLAPAADTASERQETLQELIEEMQGTNSEPMKPLKRDEIYER